MSGKGSLLATGSKNQKQNNNHTKKCISKKNIHLSLALTKIIIKRSCLNWSIAPLATSSPVRLTLNNGDDETTRIDFKRSLDISSLDGSSWRAVWFFLRIGDISGKMSRSPFQQCFCKILARSVEHLLRHLKYKELKRNWPPALYPRLTKHLKVSDVVWHYTLLHINAGGQRPASLPGTASGNKARPLSMYTLLKKTKNKHQLTFRWRGTHGRALTVAFAERRETGMSIQPELKELSTYTSRVTQSEGDFRRFKIQWAERPLRAFVWRNVPVRVEFYSCFYSQFDGCLVQRADINLPLIQSAQTVLSAERPAEHGLESRRGRL